MIKRYHRLDSLTADSLFDLLTPFLSELPADQRAAAAGQIGLVLKPAHKGLSVEIILPEFKTKNDENERLAILNEQLAALREHYGARMGRNASVCRKREFEHASPLLPGLAGLLLSGHSQCGDQPARARDGEFLAVSEPDLPMETAATLFAQLSVQSTATRWSVADIGGRSRYFFSGMSDAGRNGNAESVAPAVESRFDLLRAFKADGLTVFLPGQLERPMLGAAEPEVFPGARVLRRLKELLSECPEILDGPREVNGTETGPDSLRHDSLLLAALPDKAASNGVLSADFLALPASRFQRNFFLEPEYQRIEVEPQTLQFTEAAHDGLRSHLRNQRGCEGYRLELRDTELRNNEMSIEEVRRLRDHYTYRCHLLEEAREIRPTLLRFSHDQLPELARLLRELPLKYLHDNWIQYACFTPTVASPTSPEDASPINELSYHYLYFESGWNELADMNPLLRYASHCELTGMRTSGRPETMRFWLDPFWARPYHTGENRCLVFVPEEKALFPTLHGWDAAEMEDYLLDVLNDFISPEQRAHFGMRDDGRQRPLFVFDGPFGSDDDRISITLLDFNEFKPFRQRLDWVNDHLDILEALDSTPDRREALTTQIADMASQARWDAIHEELLSRGRPARQRVQAAAQQSHRELTEQVRGELSLFDGQLNEAYQRLQEVLEETRRLNAETEELRSFLSAAESARDEMLSTARRLQQTTESRQTKFEKWENDAAQTLETICNRRVETETSIRAAATSLNESRKQIRGFLKQLR